MLSWECTIHKIQCLSLEEGLADFGLQKQITFGQNQIHTGSSGFSCYDKLFCLGKIEPSSVKRFVSALQEYGLIRQNSVFENTEICVRDNAITILLLDIRSLSKHARDIKSDDSLLGNGVLCFTETQLQHQHWPNGNKQYFRNIRLFSTTMMTRF